MISKALLNQLSIGWIIIAILVFFVLLKVRAPYGRHTKSTWGPMISNRLGWFLMEIPSFLLILYFYVKSPNINTLYLNVVFWLWLFHYLHRALIFPFMTRTKGKKIPVVIVLMGMVFNFVNATLNGYYMAYYFSIDHLNAWVIVRLALGLTLFALGMFINIKSDYSLINLRKSSPDEYKIPTGWLFDYVSCPNYLGEILEWLGFAILAWNLPALSFFVWTAANLIPRALANHRWYYEHFDNYPRGRKALIPWIL